MKKEIPIDHANRLINHGPLVLVTSSYKDRTNIIPVSWQTPVSISPLLIAIAISQNAFSLDLIERGEEFAINVPGINLLEKVKYCGTHSGAKTDKLRETGLTPIKAHRVRPPLIEECIGHLECQLYKTLDVGDHKLFVGAVISASVDEDKYDLSLRADREGAKTIHHLGGDLYLSSGNLI